LRGRDAECADLNELIAAVRERESRALVVQGEAGVGKTALLDHLVVSAPDMRVLRATGVESEMELPFAVLHQLCAPLLDAADRLPEPQQQALSIVFNRSAGPRPDRLMVGLAVLSLLSEGAVECPLLCVVDDSQWVDTATAQTLALVSRRLGTEAVGLVFGTRESGEDFRGLPHLEVLGLAKSDADALLGAGVGFLLDERVRDRIVAETRGNPLALLELPRGLTATQLAEGFGLSGPHALPGRIENSFVRQMDRLPAEARTFLLVAAAEPVGDPVLVWRAAEKLGVEPCAAGTGEMDGWLSIGERVTFRHPLVRSAVYRSAASHDRRAAHLALGESTDPDVDPDRRAWHLATAASGPDEYVAAELERSARRAYGRGGFAAEAAFMRRCVALTRDPVRRGKRALAGADAGIRAGAFDTALEMLVAAESGPLDELGHARVDLLRAEAAFSLNRGSDAPPLLLRAAAALEKLDPVLARDTYLDAWSAALFAGRSATAGNLAEVSRAARAAVAGAEPGRATDLLLDGLTLLFTQGRAAGVPVLERALAAFASPDTATEEALRRGWLGGVAAAVVWDFDSLTAMAVRQVELARASGALAVLTVGLNVLCQVHAWAGDFDEAAALMAEARAATEATGTDHAAYGMLMFSALRGREGEAFPIIDATIARATVTGQGIAVQYARWARSIVLNALGRYEEALAEAEQVTDDTPELFVAGWALSEQVEAAVGCGRTASAAAALERLLAQTQGAPTGWGPGLAARSQALMSEGATAESCHLEAIEQLSRCPLRTELARAHLHYGEWLRREGRRADARRQLRAAHDTFLSFGMVAFEKRTRRELLATGEMVRRRALKTGGELTQQEKQIALLARDGLSNPEVGARLFISPRTVEWHLGKVFAKLNISSRKELRTALRSFEHDLRDAGGATPVLGSATGFRGPGRHLAL
jgi:DNA-binding CsgD family transcriptional regulator